MSSRTAERGFTFLEFLIVILILGIATLLAIPGSSPRSMYDAERAAQEIADALRLARTEAIRTGDPHGVAVDIATQQVTAFKANLSTNPVSQAAILYHPVDKFPYDFNVASKFPGAGVTISNPTGPFVFTGLGAQGDVLFDATGSPFWTVVATSTTYQLADSSVQLSHATGQTTVTLQSLTGRVTVQ